MSASFPLFPLLSSSPTNPCLCAVWNWCVGICVCTAYRTQQTPTQFTPQWRPLVILHQTLREDIVWERHTGKRGKSVEERGRERESREEGWEEERVSDRLADWYTDTHRWEDKWTDILAELHNAERKGKGNIRANVSTLPLCDSLSLLFRSQRIDQRWPKL